MDTFCFSPFLHSAIFMGFENSQPVIMISVALFTAV